MKNKTEKLVVSKILERVYGRSFNEVIYTQGVAVSGRIRLSELSDSQATVVKDVLSIVSKAMQSKTIKHDFSGQNFAGYVWCEDLFRITAEKSHMRSLVMCADKYEMGSNGGPPFPCDPTFRSEDMFFTSATLGRAYNFTKNRRYSDIIVQYIKDITTQKPDGLFSHNVDATWNWGRSNGFANLGLLEALYFLRDIENRESYNHIMERYLAHINAITSLQRDNGMWSQVLDRNDAYDEFSVTCMMAYSIARGLRLGWLGKEYGETLDRAFRGIYERIDESGGLKNVCVGTGVQNSIGDYLNRPAVSGFDHRGGSFALWFIAEYILLTSPK
ncbi:MAG: glycoside hydrolase family 88 protein [Dehalococcoidia bacterium]|jgi:hypothetical protein|nr:glycoside hydrolase family 88 protein [Dehalococcoidia bacterium]